ncbi:MAG TPA: MmcQ/YjbR family DNA-binding protein [Allosphingosinicella sp.]|nr:MmcQ/YjbR family DNA-binding protein [Allosphingosinicella sp.]
MEEDINRVLRVAEGLPGVELSSWYGTPALKVAGKGFARLRAAGTLMVLCPLELKEALLEAEPDLYYETSHYRGWPALLVRLDSIDDERLRDRIECAWREKAPRKLIGAFEAGRG